MSDVKRYEMHASVSRGVVFRVPVGPPHATKSEDVAFERYVLASHFDALSQQCAALEKRVSEWQPIETAPKGTRILVCGGTYSTGDHEDLQSIGVSVAHWHRDGWLDDSEYCGYEIWRAPTHWMPLPEPPK